MPALTINGWTVPLAASTAHGLGVDLVGPADSLASDGSLQRTAIASKRSLPRLQTTPLDLDEARALVRLLHGIGEVWTFDDASDTDVGSKGTGPESGSSGTRNTSTVKHGDAAWRVSAGASTSWEIGASTYTAMFWRDTTGGTPGTWVHYALTSAGDYWAAGSKNSGTDPANFTDVTGTIFSLEGKSDGGSSATSYYDHLVILPFVLADAQIEAAAADADPFGVLKSLSCGGDLVEGSSDVQMIGHGVTAQTVALGTTTKAVVSFGLREV